MCIIFFTQWTFYFNVYYNIYNSTQWILYLYLFTLNYQVCLKVFLYQIIDLRPLFPFSVKKKCWYGWMCWFYHLLSHKCRFEEQRPRTALSKVWPIDLCLSADCWLRRDKEFISFVKEVLLWKNVSKTKQWAWWLCQFIFCPNALSCKNPVTDRSGTGNLVSIAYMYLKMSLATHFLAVWLSAFQVCSRFDLRWWDATQICCIKINSVSQCHLVWE